MSAISGKDPNTDRRKFKQDEFYTGDIFALMAQERFQVFSIISLKWQTPAVCTFLFLSRGNIMNNIIWKR